MRGQQYTRGKAVQKKTVAPTEKYIHKQSISSALKLSSPFVRAGIIITQLIEIMSRCVVAH